MQLTESQLKNYLLGKTDEQAEEEIGVQIIADDGFEEKLLVAENDLMEDFLDENLSPEDEKLFVENFLVCDDRQKLLDEINFFRQYAKKHLPVENAVKEESFREKIKKLFGFDLRFAAPVLAVLIIAVFGFYFFHTSNQLSPLEKEYAELNRRDLSNADEFSESLNVSLISGTYRDSGTEKKLEEKNLPDKIFFRLALPFDPPENETLEAEVIKDEKTIFRQTEIRAYQNRKGQEVRLFLPKTILSKGRYRIKIGNPKREDSPVIYNFAVE